MAHFAKLDENNIVIDVNVVANEALDSKNEEKSGIAFLTEWSGGHSNWKQTSFNCTMRFNFAAIGYTYDSVDDAFIPPMPNCGHDELHLDKNKSWQCSNQDHKKGEKIELS
jgi:hypothetical protein